MVFLPFSLVVIPGLLTMSILTAPVSIKTHPCKQAPKPLGNSLRMAWELIDSTISSLLLLDPDTKDLTVCSTNIPLHDMTKLGKVMGDAFREIKCLYFSAVYVEAEVINDMQIYVKEILEKNSVCVPNPDIPTFGNQCDLTSYSGMSVVEVRREAVEQMVIMSEVVERMYMNLALEKAEEEATT